MLQCKHFSFTVRVIVRMFTETVLTIIHCGPVQTKILQCKKFPFKETLNTGMFTEAV